MAFNKLDNLEKLKEANKLLNKKNEQLGIKQMKIQEEQAEAAAVATKAAIEEPQTNHELKLPSEESLEKTTAKLKSKRKKAFSLFGFIGIVSTCVLLLAAFTYWINPRVISKNLNILSKTIEVKLNKKSEFGALNGLGFVNKPVLITAGTYFKLDDAINAKRKLSKLTGDALKIIKSKTTNNYSIQIGPRYTDYEDAIIVFEELVKYRINDLSIRFVEVFSY